jgi:CRISPR-associated protein Csx10
MTYLLFDLTLRSPAIVSTPSADPNSAASQLFIPGSTIRGAFAAWLIAAGEDSTGELFRRLVLSGMVRYLHAYPKISGARGLPIPLSWKSPKDKPRVAIDLAGYLGKPTEETDAEDFGEAWPVSALASCGGNFVSTSVDSGSRTLDSVQTRARVHQQRDRAKGRAWSDPQEHTHGAIFAYECIEERQTFTGMIQVTDAAASDVDRIKKFLAEPILVGRSRRAGYGGDGFISEVREFTREFAGASGGLTTDVPVGARFRVLLTSAYVGRHPRTGQVDPTALEHDLVDALGGHVVVERWRWAFETVGTFNRKWALETPQVLAVRGGSVVVLRATQNVSLSALHAVEHDGLGERRVEGFGRVVFLAHADDHDTLIRLKSAEDSLPAAMPANSTERSPQLRFLETRIVLEAARAELDRVSRLDIAKTATKLPSNSLLGRLRAPLRGALDEDSAQQCLQTLATWCGTGQGALKDRARDGLKQCRVKVGETDKQLLDWLAGLATVPNGQTGWTMLLTATGNQASVSAIATRHHLTSVEAAKNILETNAASLRVHFIDAVLAAMARRNRRSEG